MRETLFCCLSVVLLAGCGLFEPRDPEPPVSVRSTFVPPTEPSIVLTNMSAAIRELNSVNYLRCLSDSATAGEFGFEPTPPAASRYGVFVRWSKTEEEQWFVSARSQLPAGSAMSISFSAPTMQSVQPDSVQMDVPYNLSVPHGQQAIPQQVSGRSLLTISIDKRSGLWSIRRWRDIATTGTASSWSDIKGAFAQ